MSPRSPFRMPSRGGVDGVMKVHGGLASRLLTVNGAPILVRAWNPRPRVVAIRAEGANLVQTGGVGATSPVATRGPATREELELAVERMRFTLGVDDDLSEFFKMFRRDELLGPLIHRSPHRRPRRRPWAWEALTWAVTEQLIEAGRAFEIQRRIVRRWGSKLALPSGELLRDVPGADLIAGRSTAELEAAGLSARRAVAMRAVAREVSLGRCDLDKPESDRRLLSIPEIGPWTVQLLGLNGRGDLDSLPAGDLGYIKLIGRLAGLGRRAAVEEVEEFFEPYRPFRAIAGHHMLTGLHRWSLGGPPLPLSA